MIKALLATLLFFIATAPALAATKGSHVSLHHEQRDGNRASGIAFTAYNRGLALGISANKITSSKPLEMQDRTTIYPVYAFANLALRTPLAPYVEFGLDLGDYLLNELANDSSDNHGGVEEKTENPMDAYGAIGIKTSMRRAPIDFAVYVKSYVLLFNEPRSNYSGEERYAGTIITMGGANIIFNY